MIENQKEINSTVVEGRQFKNPTNIRLLVGLCQTDIPFRRAIPILIDKEENKYNKKF